MPRVSKLSRNNLVNNYLNPLDIPEIVKLILSHVNNPTTLKNVRTVNKLWRWESMDQLKQNAVLVLKNEVIHELINAYINKNEEVQTGTGLKSFFHQIYEKPFSSYKLPYEDSFDRSYILSRNLPPTSSADFPLKSAETLLWDLYLSRASFLHLGMIHLVGRADQGFHWLLNKCLKLKVLVIDPQITLNTRSDEKVDEESVSGPNLESLSIGKHNESGRSALIEHDFSLFAFQKLLKWCPNLKNLWTNGTQGYCAILEAATRARHQLESLAMASFKEDNVDLYKLAFYFLQVRPPLKSLVLQINWFESALPRSPPIPVLKNVLEEVAPTLSNLELYLDSDRNDRMFLPPVFESLMKIPASRRQLPEIDLSFEGRVTFPSLTRLRIATCFKYFEGDGNDTLLMFDFRSLKNMQKLKEFRFESGLFVEKSWVCKKITKNDLHWVPGLPLAPLPDLKRFHWHSKFTPDAITFLGKTMPSLETLEVVLDKATFPKILKTWPGLKQITLLPCSDVPPGLYTGKKNVRNGSKVVVNDQSKNYNAAQKHPKINATTSRSRPLELDMPCFQEKAHHVEMKLI